MEKSPRNRAVNVDAIRAIPLLWQVNVTKIAQTFARSNCAPNSPIKLVNTGKEVAIGAASSTVTASLLANPRQRNDMAIR